MDPQGSSQMTRSNQVSLVLPQWRQYQRSSSVIEGPGLVDLSALAGLDHLERLEIHVPLVGVLPLPSVLPQAAHRQRGPFVLFAHGARHPPGDEGVPMTM